MGHMKNEWYDRETQYDKPLWHTDSPGIIKGSRSANRGPRNDSEVSEFLEEWRYRVEDKLEPAKKLNKNELAFDLWDLQDELFSVIVAKHSDYGPKNISSSPGGPLAGINVRMYDKVARLTNLLQSGSSPKNESIRDSFVDIANYAIIALLVIDGKWDKEA